jgi:hypothetical protein
MEPHREEPHREAPKAPAPRPKEKPRRFRIVKLEERIAPCNNGTHRCYGSCGGSCDGGCYGP